MSDNTLTIHRAQPIGDQVIPSVIIIIDQVMPHFEGPDWMHDSLMIFESEAKALAEELIKALPGGTLDRLVVNLLQHQASLFIVAHTALSNAVEESR